MISPIQQAPQEFMKRYDGIICGNEVIDSVAKLKDFWLFAIDQGNLHPEAKTEIARLVDKSPHKLKTYIDNLPNTKKYNINWLFMEWESLTHASDSDLDTPELRESLDTQWDFVKYQIENM